MLVMVIVGLFVSASLTALWLLPRKEAPTNFVALYVTDLPGDLERLRVTILAATVGPAEASLELDQPLVELSDLHGPEGGFLVASGAVPSNSGGGVSLLFGGAEGYREGTWFPLILPQNRLTVEGLLSNGSFDRSSILLDFNLNASVAVDAQGGVVFQPYVASAYEFHPAAEDERGAFGEGPGFDWAGAIVSLGSTRLDSPDQFIDTLPTGRIAALCKRNANCPLDPESLTVGNTDPECVTASLGVAPATATRSPFDISSCQVAGPGERSNDGSGTGEGDSATGLNEPPYPPSDPSPADGATRIDMAPLLTWSGGDPDAGDLVTYDVTVDGKPICRKTGAAECRVAPLEHASRHTWQVTATDGSSSPTKGPVWAFTVVAAGQPANLPPLAPSQPIPVDGFAAASTAAQVLRWSGSDPDADPVEFRVLFGPSVNALSVLCNWSGQASCSTHALAGVTKLYWRVDARDPKGASVQGPVWSLTIPSRAPNPPTNPSPADGASGILASPTLTWSGTDPDGDAVTFDVFVDGAASCTRITLASCVVTSLPAGTTHSWQVKVIDPAGQAVLGPQWGFTVAAQGLTENHAPLIPSRESPSAGSVGVSASFLALAWSTDDPDGDPLQFRVFVDSTDPPVSVGCAWDIATTCLPHDAFVGARTYYWRVEARDSKAAATLGPVWSFTTQNRPPDAAFDPYPDDGMSGVGRDNILRWSRSDPDGQDVDVVVLFDESSPPTTVLCNWGPTGACFVDDLVQGTTYYWRVDSRDSMGAFTEGTIWSFSRNPPNTLALVPPSGPVGTEGTGCPQIVC